MCGIAGIWNKKEAIHLLPRIEAMCNAMKSRGPDDEGYVAFENEQAKPYNGSNTISINDDDWPYLQGKNLEEFKHTQQKLVFGFRRLSILDLTERGHQPFSDEDGLFWIIFNGEIYNYRGLRDELISRGYIFRSTSDTEVVLNAYKEWGEQCVQHFNGMFSFVLIDRPEQKLFIARDRIGIKPFYFHDSDERFVFASSIKGLLSSGLVACEVDQRGLQQNFMFAISQRPRTAFKNIRALAPGHTLQIDLNSGKKILRRYWEAPVGHQEFGLNEKKASQLLEEALLSAVSYRLQADVEVGTFMSGGIDSTLISAMAGRVQSGIKAFTLASDHPEYNEVEEAAANAKLNGLTHIVGNVDLQEVLGNLTQIVEGYEEPYHHLPVNFLISKLVNENGLKVVLNGLGGDELFAGYDAYAKLNRWEQIQMLPKIGRMLPKGIHEKADKLRQFSNINTIDEYYAHYYTTYLQEEINTLFTDPKENLALDIKETYNSEDLEFTDDLEALSFYNLKSYIGSHHVRTIDQFTMHHSLEGRFPMLDHEFIELAFRIPTRLKIHDGKQKYILRKLAKKYVAPECLKMKKKGFSLPLKNMLSNELKSLTEDTIQKLKARGVFNESAIDKAVSKNDSAQVWHLVMTEIWYQTYIDRKWRS